MDEMEFMEFDRAQKIRSIVNLYGEEACYLSFSGGRDSTVLSVFLDIVLPNNKIPRVFFDTGLEYLEMYKFLREFQKKDDRMVWLKPEISPKKIWEEYGYPFKSRFHSLVLRTYRNSLRNRKESETVKNYLSGKYGSAKRCPKILREQFTPEYPLKISEKCCYFLKKSRGKKFLNDTGRFVTITALLNEEEGVRAWSGARWNVACLSKDKGTLMFSPFRIVSNDFIDYLTEKYKIKLCPLYYEPYNFDRTGCAGCPYNTHLQTVLDIMEKYCPQEKVRCENLWKPVYDEYRRLGYRLRKEEKSGELQ